MPDQEGANQHTNKRILVLGSAPHTKMVTAYTWDNLPISLNVADYDVVILNLEPLLNCELASELDPRTLPSLQQFTRLLFSHNSEIIAIGDSAVEIGGNPYSAAWWLPYRPMFVYDSGKEIRDVEPEFAYYFRQVTWWFFHTTTELVPQYNPVFLAKQFYSVVHPKANGLQHEIRPIAQTRFQLPIAFELKFQAVRLSESYISPEPNVDILRESGRVIWLPPPTEISSSDAVDLILKERYGLQLEQAPPDWLEVYKLPEQIPIEEKIFDQEQEIQRLKIELAITQQRLQDVSRFRRLLYEQHESLELVVRDVLREFGAIVCDPLPKGNSEDGRLKAPNNKIGMLEIKSREKKSLNLDDVRQLNQWVGDALIQENLESKGILIANMYCSKSLELRDNPFPPNCVDRAERANLCLMTTTQLFHALCSYQRTELDVAEFWDTIFNTNGRCPLPELEPLGCDQSSEF